MTTTDDATLQATLAARVTAARETGEQADREKYGVQRIQAALAPLLAPLRAEVQALQALAGEAATIRRWQAEFARKDWSRYDDPSDGKKRIIWGLVREARSCAAVALEHLAIRPAALESKISKIDSLTWNDVKSATETVWVSILSDELRACCGAAEQVREAPGRLRAIAQALEELTRDLPGAAVSIGALVGETKKTLKAGEQTHARTGIRHG
jgi:hypothetical protein